MNIAPAEIETFLTLLAATPRRMASLSKGLENSRLNFKPDKNSWSAKDILAHLHACADVWGESMLAMITQDNPTLRYVSPRTWIRKTDYPELEFRVLLRAFTRQRNGLLVRLKTLSIEDWSRGAVFTGTTQGREQTVFSYVRRMAKHESEHCEQIEALLK
jgi:hypothetical protein